jgi:predicted nuclease of restriction endonuclease-like RecB superfamily
LKGRLLVREWDFEPCAFDLGDCKYIPDFKVTSMHGEVAYHEVKGYMSDTAQEKIDKMRSLYPETKLVLIDEYKYKALEQNYASRLVNWEVPNA